MVTRGNTERHLLLHSVIGNMLITELWVSAMSKSIMIVDDNEAVRRNLRRLFQASREWVICAEAVDGRDAIAKAHEFHPDFVVLDFSMPLMDGIEAALHLKNIAPKSPIIMLTAFKNSSLEEKAYKAGVSWVLSKTEDVHKVLDFARILLRPDESSALPGAPS
jgi:DNA-binding NarL/FixJ family response regulator